MDKDKIISMFDKYPQYLEQCKWLFENESRCCWIQFDQVKQLQIKEYKVYLDSKSND